jgi:hypothetical protein
MPFNSCDAPREVRIELPVKGLACAVFLLLSLSLAPIASAADGASVVQRYDAGDGRVHIDVTINYSGAGGGSYTPYVGIGTARVTLPQATGVTLPTFDSANAAEPNAIDCKIDKGAYDQDNTGYICTFQGRRQEAEYIYPSTVTLHLVSTACYSWPDINIKQPARADVWSAQNVTDGAADASYAIASSDPCAVPPPAPAQTVAGVKTRAKTCAVPQLKKLTLKKAATKLKKAGCKRGTVKRVYSTKIKKGRVIRQSVKAKRKVKRGTKVKLTLSKGKRPTKKH